MEKLRMQDMENLENRADEFLSKHKIDTSRKIDLIRLAKKEGFIVGGVDLPTIEDGYVSIGAEALGRKQKKIIGVNITREYAFKRFIVAHELGHYWLDYMDGGGGSDKKGGFESRDSCMFLAGRTHLHGRSAAENRIDYFAACLLMPRDTFTSLFDEMIDANDTVDVREIVYELAQYFGVPELSVIRRIEELDLTEEVESDGQTERLRQGASAG